MRAFPHKTSPQKPHQSSGQKNSKQNPPWLFKAGIVLIALFALLSANASRHIKVKQLTIKITAGDVASVEATEDYLSVQQQQMPFNKKRHQIKQQTLQEKSGEFTTSPPPRKFINLLWLAFFF